MAKQFTKDQQTLFDMAQVWVIRSRGEEYAGDAISTVVYGLAEVLASSGFFRLTNDETEAVEEAVLAFYFQAAA